MANISSVTPIGSWDVYRGEDLHARVPYPGVAPVTGETGSAEGIPFVRVELGINGRDREVCRRCSCWGCIKRIFQNETFRAVFGLGIGMGVLVITGILSSHIKTNKDSCMAAEKLDFLY